LVEDHQHAANPDISRGKQEVNFHRTDSMRKDINPVPGLGPIFEGWLSPGVRAGHLIYTAGFIGCDPVTGKVLKGDVEGQIRRIFVQMEMTIRAHGGSGLEDVVKMTMYFTDRKHQWPVLDRVRREIWHKNPPATTGIGIVELEQGADIEIEAVAMIDAVSSIA
jgi:2-iminobutanoate/2-iminopropanoate deaminase